MARFEIVTKFYPTAPRNRGEAVVATLKVRPNEHAFTPLEDLVLDALNSLPLRQRLVEYKTLNHPRRIEMLVENMS
jgi:hypothetical protein